MKHYIIPIFVPHLGCPHDCVFCNQKKITNKIVETTKESVIETIDEYLSYFDRESFIEVAFYGGSFTAIDMKIQRELLEIVYRYKKTKKINAIRLSTRPDCIDDVVLGMLKEYEVDVIELGVQSMDKAVLAKSGRGHDSNSVYEAFELIREYNIECGLQMMVGLPDDSMDTILYTTKEFIKLNPFCVRIYPTLVIKDTYLEELYLRDDYKALSVEEAVDLTIAPLLIFELNKVNVIRVALQVTDNIQLGKDVVSGPFHPAFRQLVDSEILYRIINKYLKDNIKKDKSKVKIKANLKDISNLAGQKSSNKEKWIENYNLYNLKIIPSDIDQEHIILEIDDCMICIDIENEKLKILGKILKENMNYTLDDFNL